MNNIDSSLLDKAIIFATNAHKGVERNGKGFPYIVHPLEVVSIIASITSDQKLLAAGALHDVIEDTDYTYEDIKKEFGEDVANLVQAESDEQIPGMKPEESWKIRKEIALKKLKEAPIEIKIIALGDKLSNLRAIYTDFKKVGENVWNKFHVKDPVMHEWRFRALADAFSDLKGTEPYREFCYIIDAIFVNTKRDFSFEIDQNTVKLHGFFDIEGSLELEKALEGRTDRIGLNFKDVNNISFGALRTILRMIDVKHMSLFGFNLNNYVAFRFEETGVSNYMTLTRTPKPFTLTNSVVSGDGYTATSYFVNDNDTMFKLYEPYIQLRSIQREKRIAKGVLTMGLPTPLSGDIIEVDGKHGITFERIMGKRSCARIISEEPDRLDEVCKDFAAMAKRLHSTKCDKSICDSIKTFYYPVIKGNVIFNNKEEEDKVLKFLDSIEDRDTCIHGDFHLGNIIFTDKGDKLFIDLADFSYGHPYFDLGTFYFVSHGSDDATAERLFHMSKAQLIKCWESFVKYYFNVSTKEEIEKIDYMIQPFSALKVLHFGSLEHKTTPIFRKIVEDYLLNR